MKGLLRALDDDLKSVSIQSSVENTLGINTQKDGSFEIHTKPSAEFADNGLPAPEGDFYMILRMYLPNSDTLAGEYFLPQVETIK